MDVLSKGISSFANVLPETNTIRAIAYKSVPPTQSTTTFFHDNNSPQTISLNPKPPKPFPRRALLNKASLLKPNPTHFLPLHKMKFLHAIITSS
ncbi:hypothetical protein CJ030_MR1G027502 [Morella rubra]|uniref:Uncharacterized protein n=1 Tax=Morella rubra TaxID=262757 RepID=A0A6A1WMQ8_9ROSI|nr:hypothetical protein CJ030_MR1G027502 [Morella rubra]